MAPEILLQVLLTAGLSGLAALAAVKVELRYLRRDIDAAHRRLDRLNAPAAGAAVPGE